MDGHSRDGHRKLPFWSVVVGLMEFTVWYEFQTCVYFYKLFDLPPSCFLVCIKTLGCIVLGIFTIMFVWLFPVCLSVYAAVATPEQHHSSICTIITWHHPETGLLFKKRGSSLVCCLINNRYKVLIQPLIHVKGIVNSVWVWGLQVTLFHM